MSDKLIPQEENTQLIESKTTICDNCHAPVHGMYCSQCGQSVESTLKYFWTVILHILDDIFSFDSRASRTLYPLMFKPGFLTNEYISGRRVHYVPPLRLYLFISIIFFISLKFFASSEGAGIVNINDSNTNVTEISDYIKQLEQQKVSANADAVLLIDKQLDKFRTLKKDLTEQPSIMLKGMASKQIQLELDKIKNSTEFTTEKQKELDEVIQGIDQFKKGLDIDFEDEGLTISNNEDGTLTFDFLSEEQNKNLATFVKVLEKKAEKAFKEDATPLIQEAIEKLPQLMFILLPLFALLLKVMFIFSKRLYLEHLTVALHSHSFIFLSILVIQLLSHSQEHFTTPDSMSFSIIDLIIFILLFWMPIYLFIMQKRVYQQGYIFTFIKYLFIANIYILMIVLTGTTAFIWGLATSNI